MAPRLHPIELPGNLADRPISAEVGRLLDQSFAATQAFHDRLDSTKVEQFVASDHRLVYQTLHWIDESRLSQGKRFIEWGCGFAVNACVAASLGWDVIAVEAEATLLDEAHKIVQLWQQPVELHHGNFLPAHAERLADDPYLPSLGHEAESLYDRLDLQIDDFDIVFAYPWPGEEDFLEQVFLKHATSGALLVSFRGPYDIQVQQKR